jgi:hypothetical protein
MIASSQRSREAARSGNDQIDQNGFVSLPRAGTINAALNTRAGVATSTAATLPRHSNSWDRTLHTHQPATCPPVEELTGRFRDRSATAAIIGLGYVGLALVQALLDNGLAVIGIDIDAGKVAARSGDLGNGPWRDVYGLIGKFCTGKTDSGGASV